MKVYYKGETIAIPGCVTEDEVRALIKNKQNILIGTAGQLVGFNGTGAAAAKNMGAVFDEMVAQSPESSSWSPNSASFVYLKSGQAERIKMTSVQSAINNRSTNVSSSHTGYTSTVGRGISLQTATPSSITNGCIVLVYS